MSDNFNPYQPVRSAPTGSFPPANPYGAPVSNPVSGQNQLRAAPLTWGQILFSFKGRIPRRTYWGGILIMYVIVMIISGVLFVLMMPQVENMVKKAEARGEVVRVERAGSVSTVVLNPDLSVILPFFLSALPVIWMILAITIKRLHDRGRSGWFMFIILLPFLGVIWLFIETGFLRGTVGDNRFGYDPT